MKIIMHKPGAFWRYLAAHIKMASFAILAVVLALIFQTECSQWYRGAEFDIYRTDAPK